MSADRHFFLYDWTRVIRTYITRVVTEQRPRLIRFWPLTGPVQYDGYLLPKAHFILVMRQISSGITNGPGHARVFTERDHPELPVSLENVYAWENYLQSRFSLRDEDLGIVLPAYDSKTEDCSVLGMFSPEEGKLFDLQMTDVLARHERFVQRTSPEPVVNYNVSGVNSRVNVNSTDSSTNIITVQNDASSSPTADKQMKPHLAQVVVWWLSAAAIVCAGLWALYTYNFPPKSDDRNTTETPTVRTVESAASVASIAELKDTLKARQAYGRSVILGFRAQKGLTQQQIAGIDEFSRRYDSYYTEAMDALEKRQFVRFEDATRSLRQYLYSEDAAALLPKGPRLEIQLRGSVPSSDDHFKG